MQTTNRLALSLTCLALGALLCGGCGPAGTAGDDRPAGSDGWLTGDAHQKFETIAAQLGGFDQTMIEVGYRYQMLYWAGEDENWALARYQIEEMEGALERGFQRRPARQENARTLMETILPQLDEAALRQDQALYRERFEAMRANCISCHVLEDVAYMNVTIPEYRIQPLK
jgi:hypothetical protein